MYQTKCVISIHVYIYLVLDESYIPCKYIYRYHLVYLIWKMTGIHRNMKHI